MNLEVREHRAVHRLVDEEDAALHPELLEERVGQLVIVHVPVVEGDEDGLLGQRLDAGLGVAPVAKVDGRGIGNLSA